MNRATKDQPRAVARFLPVTNAAHRGMVTFELAIGLLTACLALAACSGDSEDASTGSAVEGADLRHTDGYALRLRGVTTVAPDATSRSNTPSSTRTSSGCRPMVGSSNTNTACD